MCLTKRDISRLRAGETPYSLKGKPFIVIRYSIRTSISDDVGWNYSVIDSPEDTENKKTVRISKEAAMDIIERYGMRPALNIPCGKIYEMEGNPFLKKYKNHEN